MEVLLLLLRISVYLFHIKDIYYYNHIESYKIQRTHRGNRKRICRRGLYNMNNNMGCSYYNTSRFFCMSMSRTVHLEGFKWASGSTFCIWSVIVVVTLRLTSNTRPYVGASSVRLCVLTFLRMIYNWISPAPFFLSLFLPFPILLLLCLPLYSSPFHLPVHLPSLSPSYNQIYKRLLYLFSPL